jgi:hypothetical protein
MYRFMFGLPLRAGSNVSSVIFIPGIVRSGDQPIREGKADLAFNFDENNKLISDAVFAKAVDRMKREDIRLERIESYWVRSRPEILRAID